MAASSICSPNSTCPPGITYLSGHLWLFKSRSSSPVLKMKTPTVGSGKSCSAIIELSEYSDDQYACKDDDRSKDAHDSHFLVEKPPACQCAEYHADFPDRACVTERSYGIRPHGKKIRNNAKQACQWKTKRLFLQ